MNFSVASDYTDTKKSCLHILVIIIDPAGGWTARDNGHSIWPKGVDIVVKYVHNKTWMNWWQHVTVQINGFDHVRFKSVQITSKSHLWYTAVASRDT